MGPIGMPEMIMIFLIMGILVISVLAAVGIAIFLTKRERKPPASPPPLPPEN
jgi:hypothetical protein